MVCGIEILFVIKKVVNYPCMSKYQLLCGVIAVCFVFQHIISCSMNFTLRNYTIKINNKVALVVSYSEAYLLIGQDNRIRLRLNNTDIPAGVGLDNSHQFTVTVCHDVICKSSSPQTFSKCFHISSV